MKRFLVKIAAGNEEKTEDSFDWDDFGRGRHFCFKWGLLKNTRHITKEISPR